MVKNILLSFLAANILLTVLILSHSSRLRLTQPYLREYSYIGSDYPLWFGERPKLAELTFEETVHYSLDGPNADVEWGTLRDDKRHGGYVRLGSPRRVFAVAMFHQLHCINTLRRGLIRSDDEEVPFEHMHHCFSYLKQSFLCAADSTLEPYDFLAVDYDTQPVGHTRVCKDWSALYDAVDVNYQEWIDWREEYLKTNRTRS